MGKLRTFTQLATDAGQNKVWQATYQPFGQVSVSGTITQNLRIPGQYFDLESGWSHNGFRNYLPDLGRYAEPDPIGLGGGLDAYLYANDRPEDLIDPSGLSGSRPGGPYHPPSGVSTKCLPTDSCSTLNGKMYLLTRMIISHTGWDWTMSSPRGGGRHAIEIGQLWSQYAECANQYAKKCGTKQCKEATKKVAEFFGNLYNQSVDILWDELNGIWKQITTMPKQPSSGWGLPSSFNPAWAIE
jgi:RHS repeat-associated protein